MTSLSLAGPTRLFPRRPSRELLALDAFDFRRILRPLRIVDGQFHAYRPIQFLDGQMGAWPLEGGTVTATFRSSYSINSTTATYNFTTVNLGTAAADRIIALVIHPSGGSTNVNINSVTINGIAATVVVHARLAGSGVQSAVAWASVPIGTTGVTVSVVMAATKSRCAIGVWAVYGAAGGVTGSDSAIPASTLTVSPTGLTVPSGGAAIVGSSTNNVSNTGGVNVSGASERFDFTNGNSARLQGADTTIAGTHTITFTVANAVDEFAAVGMVFSP